MSSVSQTPARRMGWKLLAVLGVIAGAATIAIAPGLGGIAALAAKAHPHAPDMALLASLSPVIKLHVVAAMAALGLGAALMSIRKGRRFHRAAGWVWVGLVSLVAGSSLFITTLRPGHLSILHLLSGWVLIVLPLAVARAKRHEVGRHRGAMMALFYGGFALNSLIAFIPGRTMWAVFFS